MLENDAQDKEIAAIALISTALSGLTDAEARQRVIAYVLSRYVASDSKIAALQKQLHEPANVSRASPILKNEIPGIGKLDESGELRLTVRNLKARSGLDAAVRLAYVAIYTFQQLAGLPLSSQKGLTPLLKTWRVYDGNTRNRLAKDKGIIRKNDDLSLDAHGTRDAERYIQEILDDELEGKWKAK